MISPIWLGRGARYFHDRAYREDIVWLGISFKVQAYGAGILLYLRAHYLDGSIGGSNDGV